MQEFLAHQFAIPFFIWMSDLYMQRHPAHANLIRRAALRPGSLADIANTFIGLGGISTPCYNIARIHSGPTPHKPGRHAPADAYAPCCRPGTPQLARFARNP